MNVVLKRISQSEKGTFGNMLIAGQPVCVTLEDPWNDNQRGVSCVPPGSYECVPHNGRRFRDVWLLKNVPGRSYILIHSGNSIKDTSGCILVGREFGGSGIVKSRDTLNELRDVLPERFTLHIEDIPKKEKTLYERFLDFIKYPW